MCLQSFLSWSFEAVQGGVQTLIFTHSTFSGIRCQTSKIPTILKKDTGATVWEKIGILPHMFWWLWIHENWKIQPFLSQVHEKLFSWAGSRVDQIHWCSRGVYHLRRSQSGQAVQMTWWTCGEFFYSLCGVKDLNLSFAPTRGFPPEFWISLSVPMNRLRSGSIQRLQTGIVPTHAAFCHVQFAFVANGKMASLTNRCLHPTFF